LSIYDDIDIFDMLQSCIEFDGWFQGGLLEAPLYPLKPGVSRGLPVFQWGQAPSGPLIIRPLIIGHVNEDALHMPNNSIFVALHIAIRVTRSAPFGWPLAMAVWPC